MVMQSEQASNQKLQQKLLFLERDSNIAAAKNSPPKRVQAARQYRHSGVHARTGQLTLSCILRSNDSHAYLSSRKLDLYALYWDT